MFCIVAIGSFAIVHFFLVEEKNYFELEKNRMTKQWTPQEVVIVVILLIGLVNCALCAYTFHKSNKIYVFTGIHTLIYIGIFFLVFYHATLENFFFEVSPTRKKCLMDQVSRKNFGKKMPCSCCQSGTVGGIPPNYAQWLDKSDSDTSGWFRPDFVEYVNTFSNGEECKSKPFKQPVYVEHV